MNDEDDRVANVASKPHNLLEIWDVDDGPGVREALLLLRGDPQAEAFLLIKSLFRWGLHAPGVRKLSPMEFEVLGANITVRLSRTGSRSLRVDRVSLLWEAVGRHGR